MNESAKKERFIFNKMTKISIQEGDIYIYIYIYISKLKLCFY